MIASLRSIPFILLPAILFTGASCVRLNIGSSTQPRGGVYKSVDAGEHWNQVDAVVTPNNGSLASVDIRKIVMDPSDARTLYVVTTKGVFVSENAAQYWRALPGLQGSTVTDIVIDPQSSCTLYAAQQNRIVKSTNCGRTFSSVYDDSRADVSVTTIRVHPLVSSIIFAGLSSGDVLQSPDGGMSWKAIARFDSLIATIHVIAHTPDRLYIATTQNGIFLSDNGGATWRSLDPVMRSYANSIQFRGLIADPRNPQRFLHISTYGILETTDGGEHWSAIHLIPSPGEIAIRTLAIHPQHSQEFYYATATTILHTHDNGAHWETKKLPQGYWPTRLIIDPSNPTTLYLSMIKAQE